MTCKIRLASKCNIDSIVDGPGLRIVVWVQGCSHHCPFCHNPQTHDPKGGFEEDTKKIIDIIKSANLQSGVTFSGGEPFEQCRPLIEIAKEVKKQNLNLWVYTGYLFEQLIQKPEAYELLSYVDVLVDGRFVNELKHYQLKFKGSLNQRIIDVQKSLQAKKIILSTYDDENQKIEG